MTRFMRYALGAVVICGAATASAQDFSIDWYTIDGGGGTSTGGGFELSGTIGQPDPGFLSGGGFELEGGFWAYSTQGPPPPCVGDIDTDGVVGASDLNVLLTNWGCPNPSDNCQGSDLAGDDGLVNASDLNVLLTNWGACP